MPDEQRNEERALVVAVHADHVELAGRNRSTCGSCAARAGCGHGLLDTLGRGRSRTFALPRSAVPADVAVGEELMVGVPHGVIAMASASVYGLPLTGLVAGALLMPGGDGAALLASCLGLILGFLLARRLQGSRDETALHCRRPVATGIIRAERSQWQHPMGS